MKGYEGFSHVLETGLIDGTNFSFVIMKKLGYNLKELLLKAPNHMFSLKSVV
jgi:hypothetical protein